MAIGAMVLLAVLVFLLTGDRSLFSEERQSLYTYLDDSAALTDGSAVRLNGILIGSVTDIELSGREDPESHRHSTSRWKSQGSTDRHSAGLAGDISAENVLGDKFINITRAHSPQTDQGRRERAEPGHARIDEVVQSGYALLTSPGI